MVMPLRETEPTLTDSSFETRDWLFLMRRMLDKQQLPYRYHETKYWGCLESTATGRNFAYLHPQKNQVRLFLALPHTFDRALQKSPSTQHWEWAMPSLYVIRGPHVFERAVAFIIASFKFDRMLDEKKAPERP
jgi:hypothetical protein